MEAAGIKLPLVSGCRILVPGGGAVEAEVVGFNGDKLYMMPTDDVFGLAPGARVLPMEVGVPRLVPASASARAGAPPTAPSTCRWATPCSAAWSTAPAARSTARARCTPGDALAAGRAINPLRARADRAAARRRRARDQRAAHRRPRPAPRPVRRFRRGQRC